MLNWMMEKVFQILLSKRTFLIFKLFYKGTIIISSEEGETTDNMEKTLSEFNIKEGTQLKCDDFLQKYEVQIVISVALV